MLSYEFANIVEIHFHTLLYIHRTPPGGCLLKYSGNNMKMKTQQQNLKNNKTNDRTILNCYVNFG